MQLSDTRIMRKPRWYYIITAILILSKNSFFSWTDLEQEQGAHTPALYKAGCKTFIWLRYLGGGG